MTTIVYDHKARVVAVDSRVTKGDLISSDNLNKVSKRDGLTFIMAGVAADIETIVDTFPETINYAPQASGYLVSDGKCHHLTYNEQGVPSTLELTWDDASGSGANFALAALDFGYSAKEAVKYAAKRDVATGGRVREVHL